MFILSESGKNKRINQTENSPMTNSISTLAGAEFEGRWKWSTSVLGADKCVYGIPNDARRVVKFNPVDKSLTEIGPDLGTRSTKWMGGVLAKNDCIYCAPYGSGRFLKIDTIKGTVKTFNIKLPESGYGMWAAGALALDGCIYYMPQSAKRILKLNPEDDSVTSVGDDFGGGLYMYKYMGIVVGIDGCLYGIPFSSKRIVKFNPIDQTTSFVGKEAQEKFMCGNGVLGRDGYIYAANTFGHVLRIDTVNNSYDFVGGAVMTSHKDKRWGEPVLGIDGCIYWPPHNATHVLKFNPETNETSLVGDNLGNASMKYISGALAPDGAVCCIPANATQVLIIDPSMEFLMQFKADMKQHPIEFGLLFEKNNDGKTTYEDAVTKYGKERTLQMIGSCIPHDDAFLHSNLYPFMAAASCKNSAVAVIYYLLTRNPSGIGGLS